MATSSVAWYNRQVSSKVTNHVRRGVRKAGRILRDDARSTAPVRSGTLRRNIRHAVKSSRRRKLIQLKVGFLPDAFYGRFLQLGTAKLPPRVIIDLEANERAIITAILRGGR